MCIDFGVDYSPCEPISELFQHDPGTWPCHLVEGFLWEDCWFPVHRGEPNFILPSCLSAGEDLVCRLTESRS